MKTNKYKEGWIGIRAKRVGRAARALKRSGWMRTGGHAELNNRDGLDWLRPMKTREDFKSFDWAALANLGLNGVAFWFTDAQWGRSSGITGKQWRERAIVEAKFNAQWPNGRRVE